MTFQTPTHKAVCTHYFV